MKGRAFGQATLGFGESVFFKLPTKGPHIQPDGTMGAVQAEGIFVGYSSEANTYVLAAEDGKRVGARSVTRRPAQNRWSSERLANIKMTPWSTRDKVEPTVRFEAPTEAVDGRVAVAPPKHRGVSGSTRRTSWTMGTPRDARSAGTSRQLDGHDPVERTVRLAGSGSWKPSVSPMQANSACPTTRLGRTAPWSSTLVQMLHLLLQEEQPMENPEKYLEEVHQTRFPHGQGHCSPDVPGLVIVQTSALGA